MTNATEERSAHPEIGRRTVLIVDDAEDLRACTRLLLEGEGYHVLEAASGLAGLEVLSRAHVDVVLLDWLMPGISGERFIQALHETELGAAVAVVVLSGLPDLRGVGTVSLQKPIEPAELLRVIASVAA